MKPGLTLTVASLLAIAVVAGVSLAKVSDTPADPVPTAKSEQAPHAQRWQTDAALRTGMANIRTAVDTLEHHAHGHLDDAQVVALATQVEQQIAYLIANCKLEPRADAALHTIIVELGTGAQALQNMPANRDPIASMQRAVAIYPQQFDDPNWAQADVSKMRAE